VLHLVKTERTPNLFIGQRLKYRYLFVFRGKLSAFERVLLHVVLGQEITVDAPDDATRKRALLHLFVVPYRVVARFERLPHGSTSPYPTYYL
jgi:hypothetical protein